MVPEGWKQHELSKVARVIDCKHRTPKYVGEGIPLVSPGTIKWGELDLETPTKRVSGTEYQSLMDHCTVEIGDLVFSRNQSLGVASYVHSSSPFVLGQDTVLIKPERIIGKFIFYKLQSETMQRHIIKLAGGSTFARINLADIRKLSIDAPPLPEQKKIAQILSTWDQAITATERLLENSQQRKKGLMQQLLTGTRRLPGFEGEWTTKQIDKTGRIVSGGTPDTTNSDLWGGDVSWLTPTDITALKTHFIYDTPRTLTEKGVKESSATLMPEGSVCICTRASVGLMAISTTPITTNQGFKSIVPNREHDGEFLYYLFSFNRHVFIRYSSGSTFMELSKKDFSKITFDYPPSAEQKAIARVLASANDEIEQLQKRIVCLKQEKKALMQQLLTGKRRVKLETEAA
jgi:type I restriction enzyme S subunit